MKCFIFLSLLVISWHQINAQQQQAQNYHEPAPNYRPYSQAPANIRQLLQLQQAREPLVHLPAQPPPNLGPANPAHPVQISQGQLGAYQPQVRVGQAPQQPNYVSQAAQIAAQYRPQNQQYAPQQQPQPQLPQQPQQYQG